MYDLCFPLITKNIREGDKKWMTPEIKALIRERDKLFKKHDMKWKKLNVKVIRAIKFSKSLERNRLDKMINDKV